MSIKTNEGKAASPPTQQELDNAMELITRAARAGMSPTPKPRPNLDRKIKAYDRQREKIKALAAECEQTSKDLIARIRQVVPKEYHDLIGAYTFMTLTPYAINENNYRFYSDLHKWAKKILAATSKKPKRS